MRIGILSDTHIFNKDSCIPSALLMDFKNVEMVIHAGDLVGLSVLEKLSMVCKNVKAVAGNMDTDEVRLKLPEKQIFKIGNYKIAVMHGRGAPLSLIDLMKQSFKDDTVDLIIFGHSHTPLIKEENGIIFFNPGSPTDKVYSPYNSYGIIEIGEKINPKIIKI